MDSFNFLHVLGTCFQGISSENGLIGGLFVAGLVGGATHCAAMCGPFVIAQAGRVEKTLEKTRGWMLLPYHMGRITTYITLAVLLSGLLNLAFLFLPIRSFIIAPILMLAGLIFLVTAFPNLLKIFPWVARLRLPLPASASNFISKFSANRSGVTGQYLMGLLLGLIPCGLILAALMAAATAPSALMAGLAMAAFGIGTVPALMAVAFGGRALLQTYPRFTTVFTKGMMVISSLWLFIIAGFLLQ
jgi:uncharacterized protein